MTTDNIRKKWPIAVFDSGLGGLSVLGEIMALLPSESFLYLADSYNCPYGSRPADETVTLVLRHMDFLMACRCKLVVVACNTVTAIAIDRLRATYPVQFIGMEPALKPACRMTRTRKIGILATENTFNGRLYRQTHQKYAAGIDVFVQPGFGLVELVEANAHKGPQALSLIEKYICPMLEHHVDTIVLGCTHYPFFRHLIHQIAGDRVQVVDPSRAVAARTAEVLSRSGLLADSGNSPDRTLFTSGDPGVAEAVLSNVIKQPFRIMQLAPVAEDLPARQA